ncbi:MAG: hypothetical protein AB7L92_07125 [Alphaproteobacteria bacterium]
MHRSPRKWNMLDVAIDTGLGLWIGSSDASRGNTFSHTALTTTAISAVGEAINIPFGHSFSFKNFLFSTLTSTAMGAVGYHSVKSNIENRKLAEHRRCEDKSLER